MIKLLPNSELEVMKVIWDKGNGIDSKVVTDAMYEKKKWARTTTLTLLYRLAERGYILTDKTGRRSIYTIEITKEDYEEAALVEFANRIFGSSSLSFNKDNLNSLIEKAEELRNK